jgi:hypothetical protein
MTNRVKINGGGTVRQNASQLSFPFAEKLDEPLAELCNQQDLALTERVPVIIRVGMSTLAEVVARISPLGGSVRHELPLLSAIAAWVPLGAIAELARDDAISALELEQSFTAAG